MGWRGFDAPLPRLVFNVRTLKPILGWIIRLSVRTLKTSLSTGRFLVTVTLKRIFPARVRSSVCLEYLIIVGSIPNGASTMV